MALRFNENTGDFEEVPLTDFEFIKEQFSLVPKAAFYRFIAITNTLIGNARHTEQVRPLWLPFSSYVFRKSNTIKNAYEYSCDFGRTFTPLLYVEGKDTLDNAVTFTEALFQRMGIMDNFRKRGPIAIDYIITHELLN